MSGARKLTVKWAAMGAVGALLVIQSVPSVLAQDGIDPDADQVLSAMSTFLGGLPAFSVDYQADFDVVTSSGQKLKFSSSGQVVVQRPDKFRITRTGGIANVDFILDGKNLTIFGRNLNGYVQLPASSIDEAIAAVRDDIGFEAPGADFLTESPLDTAATDIVSGAHIGMTDVDGVSVHYLAFRGEKVDWQLWVQDGDEPLPIRYVITSKLVAGAPEYSLQFSNWNTAPAADTASFTFTPPQDAKKFSSIAIDDVGQITNTWE